MQLARFQPPAPGTDLPPPTPAVTNIVHDPERNNLFVGYVEGVAIRMFSIDSGRWVRNLVGHHGSVLSLSMATGYLVSSSTDGTLRVWDPSLAEGEKELGGYVSMLS